MAIDKQTQIPWTVSQIENEKPTIPTTKAILSGYIANSMNGGHNRTIFWKKIMAGERHRETRIKMNIKMLTPKTPTYQNLKMTLRTYFVPNSRVWDNAEKFTAQKGGSAEVKIEEYPNLRGKIIPKIDRDSSVDPENNFSTNLFNMERWRNAFISSYIPRMGIIKQNLDDDNFVMPGINALPLRGRIAIYNDFERNKEYDEEIQEYKSDEISQAEWESYLPDTESGINMDLLNMRAKRENNYYTDYRLEQQGFESILPTDGDTGFTPETDLTSWASWESKIAEARSQAENAQENDWNIIAKIRGSKLLTEGKVQLIGKRTFNLNYAAVTQSTYNTAEGIDETFQVMGQQGAYSYTEVNVPIYAGFEFNEEGFIHVIATVSADSVFESAIERTLLNISALDEYRPDLKDDKLDVLYEIEMGTDVPNDEQNYERILGFKRKYSELLKLPNVIAGDMTTDNYYRDESADEGSYDFEGNEAQIITQKTFQFFEKAANFMGIADYGIEGYHSKKIWKDYTDLLINKNQAIQNTTTGFVNYGGNKGGIRVDGNNQIFFVGKVECMAELPIDPNIAGNYTKWGEH